LIGYINQFKNAVPDVPVSTADVYGELLDNPAVMDACDVILVNYYPYWERLPVERAMARLHDMHQQVVAAAGGKKVIVSEAGWPSEGNPNCGAMPSLENACDYFVNFVSWARAENVEYFYFEAFDEAWKATLEGGCMVGDHWGVWDKDGIMKDCMDAVFYDIIVPDNWSCQTIPGGPGEPEIAFSYVPPYGGSISCSDENEIQCNLYGKVLHVQPEDYQVAVYIRVGSGWYNKPYWDDPATLIDCHGLWTCDITTGRNDVLANTIAAFLIPVDYVPPDRRGQTSLPAELIENSVAYVEVTRNP
jgi:hypothetical protein